MKKTKRQERLEKKQVEADELLAKRQVVLATITKARTTVVDYKEVVPAWDKEYKDKLTDVIYKFNNRAALYNLHAGVDNDYAFLHQATVLDGLITQDRRKRSMFATFEDYQTHLLETLIYLLTTTYGILPIEQAAATFITGREREDINLNLPEVDNIELPETYGEALEDMNLEFAHICCLINKLAVKYTAETITANNKIDIFDKLMVHVAKATRYACIAGELMTDGKFLELLMDAFEHDKTNIDKLKEEIAKKEEKQEDK